MFSERPYLRGRCKGRSEVLLKSGSGRPVPLEYYRELFTAGRSHLHNQRRCTNELSNLCSISNEEYQHTNYGNYYMISA